MDRVAELIDLLNNTEEQPELRASAALELGEIGDTRALEPLLYHMKNSDENFVRRDCAEALGLLEMEEAVDALVECMFNDPFRYARNEAAEALGKIGDKRAIQPLLKFMQEEDWDFGRASAALSLADLGDPSVLRDIMISLRSEEEFYIKRDMAKALLKFKDKRIVPLMIELLTEGDNWELRLQAATNLGWLATKSGVKALVKALKTDPHIYVRNECESALRRIAGDHRMQWTTAEAFLDDVMSSDIDE